MNNSIYHVWLNPAFRASLVPCLKNVALIAASAAVLSACVGKSDMDLPPSDRFDASLTDTPADRHFDTGKDTQPDTPSDSKPRNCTPNTCKGCCDEEDDCRVGTANRACGRDGVQCIDCEIDNLTCNWQIGICERVDPPPCNPSTCIGCCDSQNRCHTEQSATHCGINGEYCMDCSSADLQCNGWTGLCTDGPDRKCSPANCNGCCDAYDNCLDGTSSLACGVNGKLCVDCVKMDAKCDSKSHLCQRDPEVHCNSSNCKGCCDKFGICQRMLNADQCGINGSACVNCRVLDAYCDISDGQCLPNPDTCGPTNCDGCCNEYGMCVSGFENESCGSGGKQCAHCPGIAPCDPVERKCVATDKCGPHNCKGCCTLDDECVYPSKLTDFACGLNGMRCENCSLNNQKCLKANGQCTSKPHPCGPDTCAGCCSDDLCVDPAILTDNFCGRGGTKCVDCTVKNQSCSKSTGQCTSTPTCGPHNCKGCCNQYNLCVPPSNLTDSACGLGGATCVDCTVKNQSCSKSTGQCTSSPSCGPHNCKGCCDGNTCRNGTGDSACGVNGQTCVDCTASSKRCSPATQSCVSAPSCNEMSCHGCCNAATGACQEGKSPSRCGERAEVCQDCANDKGVCVGGSFGGGICIAAGTSQTCNADTCRGCCECLSPNNCVCREGTKPQQCGHDGRICQTCNMNSSVACVSMVAGGGRCTYVGAP